MSTQDSVQSVMIEEGFVTKRGPRPLRIWQKRYFRLAAAQSYPLNRLRLVYRKNAKRVQAPREEFERANAHLLETLATATVDASRILAYFKSDDKDELPQGFINFAHVTEVEASPKIKPYAFTVKTKSRDYVFSTNSQKDTDAWIGAFNRLASKDPVDCSDTAAYKFSYNQLAERKGFASPSVPAQDDEVFSASEGEYEVKESAPQPAEPAEDTRASDPAEPAAEAVAESTPEPAVVDAVPDAASPRKSFYTEVIDFFHRKVPEAEAKPEVKPEAEAVEVASREADKEAEEVPEEADKPTEFSKEIAEMVAPISSDPPSLESSPVAAAADLPAEAEAQPNKPTRTKTFNMPKFEGKIFSKFFKKGGSDEESTKEANPNQEASQEVLQQAKEVSGAEEPTQEPTQVEAGTEPVVVLAPEEPSAKVEVEVEPIAKPADDAGVTQASVQEQASVVDSVSETVVESVQEAAQQFTREATSEVSEPASKEEKRPFLTRLLSGGHKKEEPVETSVEPVLAPESSALVEEAEPVNQEEPSEEKRPFIKRLLSGNLKHKGGATSPTQEAHPEPAVESGSVEVASEPTSETIEAAAFTEEPAETEAARDVEASAPEEQPASEAPAAQRQASLMTRIGELAYSAVAPAAAAEEVEEISEHYMEKSKDAAYAGFLYKQSTLLHTNNLRYVILSKEGVFTYYRNAQVPSEGKKVVIDDTVQVGPVDELIISIKPLNAYALLFQAKDRQERDRWGAALAKFASPATKEEVTQAVAEALNRGPEGREAGDVEKLKVADEASPHPSTAKASPNPSTHALELAA
ncbi:hypothetical protein L0F63_001652 [Massospora cicadina]|nr:hypothetical protein L0F63_001652 [Massospora cicadina]